MPQSILYLIVFLGGVTALSWQVLWQLDLSISLGVSAKGTALTVATVMAGLALGARLMAKRITSAPPANPWRLYGLLEISIGLSATLPRLLQPIIENVDSQIYLVTPWAATLVHASMLGMVIGPSAVLMGSTIPVIGLLSSQTNQVFSKYYAANTAGAALGCLLITFFLLPALGRTSSAGALILIQGAVFLTTLAIRPSDRRAVIPQKATPSLLPELSLTQATMVALVTGMATFILELSWFRLLRASWLSTTDSFAIMLFVFLIALAAGSWLSQRARQVNISIGGILVSASLLVWLATPIIERFDLWGNAGGSYLYRMLARVLAAVCTMGPPITLIGLLLPRLLDEFPEPRQLARIYGWNTLSSVLGSLLAGWFLLAWVGPVATSWIAASLLAIASLAMPGSLKKRVGKLGIAAFGATFSFFAQSGVGTGRVQGPTALVRKEHILVDHINGPDATTSVVKVQGGYKVLFIDGYAATGEFGLNTAYMDAMGRLPMLLHPNPKSALVICFGTGQTTNAVRHENPKTLTVVDVNPATYELAKHFPTNQNVLQDPRVKAVNMDGRAWLRRNRERYDIVTLEPMPPFFAGSNSLYSVEFYETILSRLSENGCVAQWFPLHLMSPNHAKSVAAAFVKIFPSSILWVDPLHQGGVQAILVGQKGGLPWNEWPGFDRYPDLKRPLTREQINQSIFLNPQELEKFTDKSVPVTDNNQTLSYGTDGIQRADHGKRSFASENMSILRTFKSNPNP